MELHQFEVFATDSNYAVIKPPGRHFPGCVIQGDSLKILADKAISIAKSIRNAEPMNQDFLGDLQDLVDSLVGRLLHYQTVLQAHGIPLPYSQQLTEADQVRLLPEES